MSAKRTGNCDFEKKQVTATLPWKTDPREAFHPRNSNRGVVEKMATSLFKSLKRDGKLYEYTAAFMDAVPKLPSSCEKSCLWGR